MKYTVYERYVTEVYKNEIEQEKEVIVPLTDERTKERIMARVKIGPPSKIKNGEGLVLKTDSGFDKPTDLVVKILEKLPPDHETWGQSVEMRLGKKPAGSGMI